METAQECFGWAAACLTVCFYMSPVIPFINVLKGKLPFEDSPGVFVTTCYVNCFVWYVFGDMIFSDQLKISNLIAAISSLILIVIYLIYELKKYLLDSILNALIIISGTWAVYRALTIMIDDDRIVGKIGIGTLLIVFLTPMYNVYKVIKDKNYNLISIYSAWIYLFACIFWVVYGFFIVDYIVIIPHIGGILLSLFQIIVFLTCKRKYPGISEKVFSSTIGIESTGNDEIKKEESTEVKIDEEPKAKVKKVKIISKVDN